MGDYVGSGAAEREHGGAAGRLGAAGVKALRLRRGDLRAGLDPGSSVTFSASARQVRASLSRTSLGTLRTRPRHTSAPGSTTRSFPRERSTERSGSSPVGRSQPKSARTALRDCRAGGCRWTKRLKRGNSGLRLRRARRPCALVEVSRAPNVAAVLTGGLNVLVFGPKRYRVRAALHAHIWH